MLMRHPLLRLSRGRFALLLAFVLSTSVTPAYAAETCEVRNGIRICATSTVIVPKANSYVATITLHIAAVDAKSLPIDLLVLRTGDDLNVNGVSGWRLSDVSGVDLCNNVVDANCATKGTFTRIATNSGDSPAPVTMRWAHQPSPEEIEQMAEATSVTFTARALLTIGGKPATPVTWSLSGLPVSIKIKSGS